MPQIILYLVRKALSVVWLLVVTLVVLVVLNMGRTWVMKEVVADDGRVRQSLSELETNVSDLESAKRALSAQYNRAEKQLRGLQQINLDVQSAITKLQIEGISVSPLEWSADTRDELFVNKICSIPWHESICAKSLSEARSAANSDGYTWRTLENERWASYIDKSLEEYCEEFRSFRTRNVWEGAKELAQKAWNDGKLCRAKRSTMNGALSTLNRAAKTAELLQATYNVRVTQSSLARDLATAENEVSSQEQKLSALDQELELAYAARDEARKDPRRFVEMLLEGAWEKAKPFVPWAAALLFLVFFGRVIVYFVLAPVAVWCAGRFRVSRSKDVPHVRHADDQTAMSLMNTDDGEATIRMEAGQRQVNVELRPQEFLWVRPEYVVSSYKGKSVIFYSLRHFILSFLTGLTALTRFNASTRKKVVIGNTESREGIEYIGAIQLTNHPGFVVRPRALVAIQGEKKGLELKSRWTFGRQAFLRLQFRYILVRGTGTLYIAGNGGVFPQAVGATLAEGQEKSTWDQLNNALLVAWDPNLHISLRRNENALHVAFLKRDAMFETGLEGEGLYVQVHSEPNRKATDPGGRMLEAILNAFGKVLGI